MEPITIRIDEELQAKLDARRGDEKKSDFYRKILEEYVNTADTEEITNQGAQITPADKENTLLREDIQYLRSKLDESMRLISNEQALHLQTQRLLPAPEPGPTAPAKKWWEIWK
ncbi:MAG: hypothetical protein SCH66_14940 [Methanolobus sp.]|nr:hypothetical protein [Methanolobus sp.]